MTFGVAADISSFSGTIEFQQNPLTATGTGGTPAMQPAAQTTPTTSESGVQYFDGTVTVKSIAMVPDTVTQFWNQQLIWTNNPLLLTGSYGSGMTSADQPELIQFNKTNMEVTDGNSAVWFQYRWLRLGRRVFHGPNADGDRHGRICVCRMTRAIRSIFTISLAMFPVLNGANWSNSPTAATNTIIATTTQARSLESPSYPCRATLPFGTPYTRTTTGANRLAI